MNVTVGRHHFTITLDSGATVSFISTQLATRLGLTILPNGQLANLADARYRSQSRGEVDFLAVERSTGEAVVRMRALVLDHLSVECYGGTMFHLDNHSVADITANTVSLHNGRFLIKKGPRHGPPPVPPPYQSTKDAPNSRLASLMPPKPPPYQSIKDKQPSEPSSHNLPDCAESETILMKSAKSIIPQASYAIPLQKISGCQSVLVFPPPPKLPSDGALEWQPQVCPVVQGAAIYTNSTTFPLAHQKNTHFRVVSLKALDFPPPSLPPPKLKLASLLPQASTDILSQIKINTELLSSDQLLKLSRLHAANISAFDEDMSKGFGDPKAPFFASFSFRQESKAPPYKLWCPQFNRGSTDLLQAKCDELEQQGVLADPFDNAIEVRNVSPCLIQQKARAKHKPLDKCTLDEVRFITCYNVLNESIQPISNRSRNYNDILKFIAGWKYHIHADLANSYFQIKVNKKLWKYLAVLTPHRGIKVLTRLGQGLLNSDVSLDQVMSRALGDEMTAGICMAARDDLVVGGDTVDEAIHNWSQVLAKITSHNLKLNPQKVRILLQDTEIYGHRIINGKIRPSEHIVSSLASTTTTELVTVKQVNSWKGLYKVLIRHLPQLASYMTPFDTACAGKPSSSNFDWSQPGMVAAFNAATKHLEQVRETFLPRPQEQLILMPDTSKSHLCSGWVMYTERQVEGKPTLLPVQYASAKLPGYMSTWSPCELEGVGSVTAIDQTRHWINESKKPTLVLCDNKPTSDAANLMRIGRHSTNARLQTLLTSVNRSPVIYRHNSAKAGLHAVPDALSRTPRTCCSSKDCQVERFLRELPDQVQCMSLTMENLALGSTDPAILAATATELDAILKQGGGPLPLGSRPAWAALQQDCQDCRRFFECKRLGQLPGKKDKDRVILNKLLKKCEVEKGIIVCKSFDPIIMKEIDRIYVPSAFVTSILTVLHVRLDHPLPSQLQRLFERYFVAFGVKNICDSLAEECSFCISLKKFPMELAQYTPSPMPEHPGSHMNVDIMRRATQHIMVNCDRFSSMVTAFAESEKREDMVKAILAVVTPIRHSNRVQVRADKASALQSLASRPDEQLQNNGIDMVLGHHGNPNSNCSVDKIIQELEAELKRLEPEGLPLSAGTLSRAVTTLNNRIRQHGFSAAQVHFSRDYNTGVNLSIKDEKFKEAKEKERERVNPLSAKSKAPRGKVHEKKEVKPGQIVYLRSEGDKHKARNPLLVTRVNKDLVTVHNVLHSDPQHKVAPNIQIKERNIEERFLYIPPHKRAGAKVQKSAEDAWWRGAAPTSLPNQIRNNVRQAPINEEWRPNAPPTGEEDDVIEIEMPTRILVGNQVHPVGRQPLEEEGGGPDQHQLEEEEVAHVEEQQQEMIENGEQEQDLNGQQQLDVGAEAPGEDLWAEGAVDPGPPPPDPRLPPEAFPFPPWPPAPRRRLGATSATPRRGRKASTLDIVGRVVSAGEAIKFKLPDGHGGDRRGGIMSATVLHMSKKDQGKWPRSYNIRTQDRVDMSVELDFTKLWWVFRAGSWYPGDHPNMPPPDDPLEGEEEQ